MGLCPEEHLTGANLGFLKTFESLWSRRLSCKFDSPLGISRTNHLCGVYASHKSGFIETPLGMRMNSHSPFKISAMYAAVIQAYDFIQSLVYTWSLTVSNLFHKFSVWNMSQT